jgi:hypothetical protein
MKFRFHVWQLAYKKQRQSESVMLGLRAMQWDLGTSLSNDGPNLHATCFLKGEKRFGFDNSIHNDNDFLSILSSRNVLVRTF